jgi:FkbM family methyltransferase
MRIRRAVIKIKKAIDSILLRSKVSYAQSGEDIIADYFFQNIGISKPTYIDIGANHPFKGSNTYLFYLKGGKGICIEPDITLIKTLKKKRPNDLVLNLGVSIEKASEANFYHFKGHYRAWNTFSLADAEKKQNESGIPFNVSTVRLETVNDIIQAYHPGHINFMSLDVEGWDLQILKSIDFSIFKPELVCVESIGFSLNNILGKNSEMIDYMQTQGYSEYANTNLNTLFCRNDTLKLS